MTEKVRAGLSTSALLGDKAWDIFEHRASIKRRLTEIVTEARAFGQSQVMEELDRQKVDILDKPA